MSSTDLFRAEITFTQDGNTLGTTEEVESITICFETQLPGAPPFIVVKTNGWSTDDCQQLLELVGKCQSAIETMRKAVQQ